MSLKKSALLLTHLIALAAFSSLVMNDFFHWLGAVIGLGLLSLSFLFVFSGKRVPPAPRVWSGLSILCCLFFLIDLLWLSRDLLSAGMHFLTYLMAYRLFHLENAKDELQLYLIGFLQLLAAAGDGSHFGYAVAFLFSSFFMVGGLLVQHFKREQESRSPALAGRSIREVIPSRFLMMPPLLTFIVLMVTLLVFFLIPRVGIAFFQKKAPSLQKISGFSERVDLGALGAVKLDPSSVMRVVPMTEEKGVPPPYLRGMSFDAYDGRAWQNTLKQKKELTRGIEEGFLVTPPPRNRPTRKKTILLEPLETSVLFTADKAASIQVPLPSLLKDLSGTLYLPSNIRRRLEYEITSFSEPVLDSDRATVQIDYPSWIRDHYLAADVAAGAELSSHLKIAALARDITASSSTVYEKAAAIEHYLKSNYTYTLDVPLSSRPPLEAFLFDHKKGYCEYYASAMVLLLRSIGIAARLVTGFLPGEWNEVGRYYLIRQSDAHAWVEVYFPEERWQVFDPTPSVPQDQNALLKMTAAYLDWMQLKWDRHILRYSLRDQFDFVQGVGERFGNFSDRFYAALTGWKQAFRPLLNRAAVPLALALLLIAVAVLVGLKRGRFRIRKKRGEKEISAIYREMLRILAGKGLMRKAHQTPLEFVEKVRTDHQELVRETEGITQIYCGVRFGRKGFSREEALKIEALLNQLRGLR